MRVLRFLLFFVPFAKASLEPGKYNPQPSSGHHSASGHQSSYGHQPSTNDHKQSYGHENTNDHGNSYGHGNSNGHGNTYGHQTSNGHNSHHNSVESSESSSSSSSSSSEQVSVSHYNSNLNEVYTHTTHHLGRGMSLWWSYLKKMQDTGYIHSSSDGKYTAGTSEHVSFQIITLNKVDDEVNRAFINFIMSWLMQDRYSAPTNNNGRYTERGYDYTDDSQVVTVRSIQILSSPKSKDQNWCFGYAEDDPHGRLEPWFSTYLRSCTLRKKQLPESARAYTVSTSIYDSIPSSGLCPIIF